MPFSDAPPCEVVVPSMAPCVESTAAAGDAAAIKAAEATVESIRTAKRDMAKLQKFRLDHAGPPGAPIDANVLMVPRNRAPLIAARG